MPGFFNTWRSDWLAGSQDSNLHIPNCVALATITFGSKREQFSNKMIEKGLAFLCKESGTATGGSLETLRVSSPPALGLRGASVVRPDGSHTNGDPDDQVTEEANGCPIKENSKYASGS